MAHSANLTEAVTAYYSQALGYAVYRTIGARIRGTIAACHLTVYAPTEADCRLLMGKALEQWMAGRLNRGVSLPKLYGKNISRVEAVYQVLREYPQSTLQDIAEHVGVRSITAVVRSLRTLEAQGRIIRRGSRRKPAWRIIETE